MPLPRVFLAVAAATCLAADKPAGQPTGAPATLGTVEIDGRAVPYRVVDGFAVVFGDILVGTVEELERRKQTSGRREASVVNDAARLWPNATVTYFLDPGLSTTIRDRFLAAAAQWQADTPLRFVPRTSETSYVWVRQPAGDSGCLASIGRGPGWTIISLASACGLDAVTHEIGHTAGLWHEHARQDRDRYVELLYANVQKTLLSDFNTNILAGADDGPYDYSSLMHYSLYGGSRNGNPVMRTLPPGLLLAGSRLSPGDIDAVRRLYGSPPSSITVTTNPAGLQIVADGRTLTSPQTFDWAPGSSHTLSVPSPQGTGDTRHVFGRWSNDGPQTQTIVASSTTYVAHMVRQCKAEFASGFNPRAGSYTVTPLSPDDYYTCDSAVTLTATPASGQAFQTWNWSDLAGRNPVTFSVDVPRGAIYPTFTDQPMVTVNTSPPGLRVVVDGVTTWTPRNYLWSSGSRHTLVASNRQDGAIAYVFSRWSQGGPASQTIVAPESGATYVATFQTRYLLSTGVAGTGTVTASPPSADGYYDAGTTVQLTAQPAASFGFWTGDTTGTANPQSVVMDDERVAVAYFGPPGSAAISALTPPSVVAGTAPFLLNVAGAGFYEGLTQVQWNGAVRPFRVVSSSEMQIQLTAADLSAPGQATISVSNPGFAQPPAATATFTVTPPPSNCAYTLSPASLSLGSYGGSATVAVGTDSGCAWSATSDAAWTEVIPPPRSPGSGTLNLWVAPNSSSQSRTSTVRVAGQAVTISQAGAPCNASLAPPSNTVPSAGGNASLLVILLVGDCGWTASSNAAWLRITSATSGTGGAVITYTVDANRDPNARAAEIRVGNQTATVQQAGSLPALAAVSAASFTADAPLAPGSLGTVFGQGLAKQLAVATALPLPTILAGTRLVFQKPDRSYIASALLFVSSGQINFVVPPLPDGPTLMVATIDEQGVSSGTVVIRRVAPGLFSANADGRGSAAAIAVKISASGTQTSQLTFQCGSTRGSCVSLPIDLGAETDQVILLLFGTGIRGRSALDQVTATIGGVSAEVLYAGLQGEFEGLDQVNLRLPRALAGRGELNVVLRVEGQTANIVTVNTQ